MLGSVVGAGIGGAQVLDDRRGLGRGGPRVREGYRGGTFYLAARNRFGGPPKIGELYGRYDDGTVEPSAVIVPEGALLPDVDVTVHTVW